MRAPGFPRGAGAAGGGRALPPPSSLPPVFLGRHPAVVRLLATVHRLAPTPLPVLLLGETGTGKDLLARILHANSPRAAGPFRALNCASVPVGLLEAEVFGAARGAFTGAGEGRPGILESADGGTLFLDEVGDMPPALQAAILRSVEDGVTRRLGETAERRTSLRIVAATNRDLDGMVRRGEFRADLRWRLGRALRVPPLRERREDLLLLARAFLAEAAAGGIPARLAPEAERALLAHPFPGNVRELRSSLVTAAALARDGVVRAEDLGLLPPTAVAAAGVRDGGADPVPALLAALGPVPVREVARALGLPRRTVQRRLARLVEEGRIRREGRGPGTRYRAAPGKGP